MKFLCVVFVCSFIVGGNCQPCTEKNLKITQSATGKYVRGNPEWNATINNDCICTQYNVKLSCDGFQTVEHIDPSILSKTGSECLVNNGAYVPGYGNFSFAYAWRRSFAFKPLFSQVACS